MPEIRGAVPCVVVGENGTAHVEARRCKDCGAILTRASLACPSCGARDSFETFRVTDTGRLHAYAIVHRSFPGIAVPFISAIVDMDDGTVLKGNLRGLEPEPEAIAFGMKLRIVIDDAGRSDAAGNHYLAYFFEAA